MAKPAPWLVPAVWFGGLAPVPMLAVQALQGELGSNPVAEVLNRLGLLAFISLLACLACTPAQKVFSVTWPVRIRKHLGNLAFTYACLHFLTWAILDLGLNVSVLVEDVVKRPFITIGFVALLCLIPLSATSTANGVRRLGFARWKKLHRLTYVVGALVCVHFIWRVKSLTLLAEPVVYTAVFTVLMAARVAIWGRANFRKRRAG